MHATLQTMISQHVKYPFGIVKNAMRKIPRITLIHELCLREHEPDPGWQSNHLIINFLIEQDFSRAYCHQDHAQ